MSDQPADAPFTSKRMMERSISPGGLNAGHWEHGKKLLVKEMSITRQSRGPSVPRSVGILEVEMQVLDAVCLLHSSVFHPSLYSSRRSGLFEMQEIVSTVNTDDSKAQDGRVWLSVAIMMNAVYL